MDQYRQLMNVMGPERVLMAGGAVSGLAILVLILGWVLVGFWAGLLGAIIVVVGAYVALQRVLEVRDAMARGRVHSCVRR